MITFINLCSYKSRAQSGRPLHTRCVLPGPLVVVDDLLQRGRRHHLRSVLVACHLHNLEYVEVTDSATDKHIIVSCSFPKNSGRAGLSREFIAQNFQIGPARAFGYLGQAQPGPKAGVGRAGLVLPALFRILNHM